MFEREARKRMIQSVLPLTVIAPTTATEYAVEIPFVIKS